MSAIIQGVNAPVDWTYWTVEMASPVVFTQTVPIGTAIEYSGSITGEGISAGGDAIHEIRAFIDINALPVATFQPTSLIQDGGIYTFDFETGLMSVEIEPSIISTMMSMMIVVMMMGMMMKVAKGM